MDPPLQRRRDQPGQRQNRLAGCKQEAEQRGNEKQRIDTQISAGLLAQCLAIQINFGVLVLTLGGVFMSRIMAMRDMIDMYFLVQVNGNTMRVVLCILVIQRHMYMHAADTQCQCAQAEQQRE